MPVDFDDDAEVVENLVLEKVTEGNAAEEPKWNSQTESDHQTNLTIVV